MRILFIAYPLLTLSDESAGGAEQVLRALEREVDRRGFETTVAASSGSVVAGELFATGDPCRELDDFDRRNHEHQGRVVDLIQRRAREGRPFALVHDMSGSFWARAPEINLPVLATLHLPRSFYSSWLFERVAPNVLFNCVSYTQSRSFRDVNAGEVAVTGNGIALDLLSPNLGSEERSGLLWLGRVCEEKAPHLALEIARQASLPITMAGQIYPFSYHQRYFEREVAPRLRAMPNASFVLAPSHGEKRRLLRRAQALLITSQAEETSSLVAMEAAASATPVIAFRRGAVGEVVRQGRTGFLADTVREAVVALRHTSEISPEACLEHARENFSAASMADRYLALYRRLLVGANGPVPSLAR